MLDPEGSSNRERNGTKDPVSSGETIGMSEVNEQ